jgi:predicted secreted protein
MGITTGIMVFAVIWWIVLFAVLPLGVRRIENPTAGVDRGAPEHPQLLRKALITTAITALLWTGWYVVWTLDLLSFRVGG